MNLEMAEPAWKRFAVRFLLCYLAMYCVDLLGEILSFSIYLFSAPLWLQTPIPSLVWVHVVPWVSMHVLHAGPVKFAIIGSGDTLYDWVLLLCEGVLAFIAALVWSLVDPRRRRSSSFHLWLRVTVRALLAAQMLLYGLDKVFPVQFREMTILRMMQPMASKTPMGVLWDFMAASTGYTIFTGLVEVLAGVLLLVPAWTTLGALLAMAAMTNIVALNFFYDIPVKNVSSHLLLLSLFLLAPALPRLVRFFLLNRAVPTEPQAALSARRIIHWAVLWAPVALCGIVVIAGCYSASKHYQKWDQARLRQSKLYGAWNVSRFTVSDPSKPLFTDILLKSMDIPAWGTNWRRVIFEADDSANIELGDGALDYVRSKDEYGTLTITDQGDPRWVCLLKARRTGRDDLTLDGTINGIAVQLELRRIDETQFMLTKRRFHWVNEW